MTTMSKGAFTTIALLAVSIGLASAEEAWKAVVLKASSVQAGPDGSVSVTLSSGRNVTFTAEEWSQPWSKGVDSALADQNTKEAADDGHAPPSDSSARPTIRSNCAAKWSDDFKMQKYCQDKQFEALAQLRARNMSAGAYATIRRQCSEKWESDYKMRDYCEKKQVEAYQELNR